MMSARLRGTAGTPVQVSGGEIAAVARVPSGNRTVSEGAGAEFKVHVTVLLMAATADQGADRAWPDPAPMRWRRAVADPSPQGGKRGRRRQSLRCISHWWIAGGTLRRAAADIDTDVSALEGDLAVVARARRPCSARGRRRHQVILLGEDVQHRLPDVLQVDRVPADLRPPFSSLLPW